jgi:uncharacterized membrane protein YhaH (DUF805 family)
MNWYLAVLKNYVGFSGRARRTEYWMFVLFNFIIGVVLEILAAVAHPLAFLYYLYALAVLLPSLAVGFRRLHDTNRTAWWLLIGIIPIIGWIWLLVLFCQPGTQGPNQYGPDPKAVDASYAQ